MNPNSVAQRIDEILHIHGHHVSDACNLEILGAIRASPSPEPESAATEEEFASVLTPEQQEKYEVARQEIHKAIQPLLDEIKRSTRLTGEDYSIVINAK